MDEVTAEAFKNYGDLVLKMERDAAFLQMRAHASYAVARRATEDVAKLRVAFDAWALSLDAEQSTSVRGDTK